MIWQKRDRTGVRSLRSYQRSDKKYAAGVGFYLGLGLVFITHDGEGDTFQLLGKAPLGQKGLALIIYNKPKFVFQCSTRNTAASTVSMGISPFSTAFTTAGYWVAYLAEQSISLPASTAMTATWPSS